MKKRIYTNTELFKLIMDQLQSENRVPDILDYALAENDPVEIRNYEFDVLGAVNYGGSEGIYIDLFLRGNIGYGWGGKEHTKLGTIKTLRTDDDSFRQMAVLMADFQIAATRFVNAHLDDFTWIGYDIEYFREGETERSYGITGKAIRDFEEATEEAKRTMKRFPRYVKAVITHDADEKTKTVYGNEEQMRYFEIWLQENPDVMGGMEDFDMCIRGFREPTIEEAEAFIRKDRILPDGKELHVTHLEEISYRDAIRDFDLSNVDEWPVFGLDKPVCKHCVNGDCEMSCEDAPCSGSLREQDECAYC